MTQTTDTIFIAATIGASFATELKEANLNGAPISYSQNGVYISKQASPQTMDALQNVINNHDPLTPDPSAYIELRKKAYPPLGDQLDTIMKWAAAQSDNTLSDDFSNMAQKCMAIKSQYPKPE